MEFVIAPLLGVGPVRFGMSQSEVRQAMQSPHESFLKSASSAMPTDSFLEDSVHVFYEAPGRCVAVEFYDPSQVPLNSKNILGIPYSAAKDLVSTLDPNIEEDEAGFTSRRLGIGAYAPSHRKYPDDPTESIIVFESGYYDN